MNGSRPSSGGLDLKTDESERPKPKPPQEGAWFPGLYQFPFWHRIRRHKVGIRRRWVGGMWDGMHVTEVTCLSCDDSWERVVM